jgi:prepilin-type N-terminal cleavage/methylation domain-containing protein
MNTTSKRKDGFTLIELLVVLTVITVLISSLLPAVSQARQVAYKSICASNFQQISIGSFSYAADNKQCFPNLNDGAYGTLGVAGAGYPPGYNGWTWDQICAADEMFSFSRDYMNCTWTWNYTSQLVNVPKVYVCPGLPPPSVAMLGPLYPGETQPNQGYHKIGSAGNYPYGGTIVGFGSFLGEDDPWTDGNNLPWYSVHNNHIRSDRMTHPTDDPIILDLVPYRWDIGQNLVAHGTNGTPWGANECFADGSHRWVTYADFNVTYNPIYGQDRKTVWMLYNGARGQYIKGGYPQTYQYDGVRKPPDDWFGVAVGWTNDWVH